MDDEVKGAFIATLLALGDDHLILGHRLSEWCGHAPMLEEDLSLANMGLDMLGQASHLFSYAARLEDKGKSEDDLAFLRFERDYTHCLLVERPNTDFAHTMVRQFYFAAFMEPFWRHGMASVDETFRGIAGKAVKEIAYHRRHAAEWVIRLGDGTKVSRAKVIDAVETLHPYTAELFEITPTMGRCIEAGLVPPLVMIEPAWQKTLQTVFGQAELAIPVVDHPQAGGREGCHSEHLGFLLAQLQFMQRSFPGLSW